MEQKGAKVAFEPKREPKREICCRQRARGAPERICRFQERFPGGRDRAWLAGTVSPYPRAGSPPSRGTSCRQSLRTRLFGSDSSCSRAVS